LRDNFKKTLKDEDKIEKQIKFVGNLLHLTACGNISINN
jgi:hypothetical protein